MSATDDAAGQGTVATLRRGIEARDGAPAPGGADLPVPRLQLRWATPVEGDPGWGKALSYLEQGENAHRRWICHYELVLPLRENDIRRERDDAPDVVELVIPISKTQRGATNPPVDEPFRDGVHAGWDASHIGNPPIYVLPIGKPPVLLSELRAQRDACWESEGETARAALSTADALVGGAATTGGA